MDKSRLELARQKLERLEPVKSSQKRKSGRPRKWIGRDGYILMLVVNSLKAERRRGIADAVRILKQRAHRYPQLQRWLKFSDRELQIRYQEARRFWIPWAKRFAEVQEISDLLRLHEPKSRYLFDIFVTKSPGDFS